MGLRVQVRVGWDHWLISVYCSYILGPLPLWLSFRWICVEGSIIVGALASVQMQWCLSFSGARLDIWLTIVLLWWNIGMHTHTISELQKVNFAETVFNSSLLLSLLHSSPARRGSALMAAACVTNWNIEIPGDELKDMQRTYPAGLCQIAFCVSGSLPSDGMRSVRGVWGHAKGREAVRCVPWMVMLTPLLLEEAGNAVESWTIQTRCNSDTQCSWNLKCCHASPRWWWVARTSMEMCKKKHGNVFFKLNCHKWSEVWRSVQTEENSLHRSTKQI